MTEKVKTLARLYPWVLTVPLIIAGFGCSVFFTGTDSMYFVPSLLCVLMFGVLAIVPRIVRQITIPRSAVALFMALWGLYVALSVTWSHVPYISTQFALFFCVVPFVFFTVLQTDEPHKWSRVHTAAMLFVFGGFAVWAWIQFYFLFDIYGRTQRIHHPMLNPNSLAGVFNMAILLVLGLFVWAKKQTHIVGSFALLLVLYGGLIMTQSRAGIVFEGVSALVFFAVLWRFPSMNWTKAISLAAMVLLVPFVLSFAHPKVMEKNLTQFSPAGTAKSMNDRYDLVESTWEMVKAHPFAGTGLSSFYFYYPRYRLPTDKSDGFFAHIDPLQFWAEMGILAPLIFYGLLTLILLRTIKAMRALPKDSSLRLEIMAPFCALLAIAMHAHMTFHLYILAMLFPIAFLLVYWYTATKKALGDEEPHTIFFYKNNWQRGLAVLCVVTIVGFAAQWAARAGAGVYLTGEAINYMNRGQFDNANKILTFSQKVVPKDYYRLYQLKANLLLTALLKGGDSVPPARRKQIYNEAIEQLDLADEYAKPFSTLAAIRAKFYYYAYNQGFKPDGLAEAERLLVDALKKNPLSWDVRDGLATIYRSQGYIRKAYEVLEAGRHWPMPKGPYIAGVFVKMAQLQQQLGNKQKAQELLNDAQFWAKSFGNYKRP